MDLNFNTGFKSTWYFWILLGHCDHYLLVNRSNQLIQPFGNSVLILSIGFHMFFEGRVLQQGQILGALMPCDQRRGQYRSAQLSPKSTRRSGGTHFTWPGWWDIWWSDGNFIKFHPPEEHGLKRVELAKLFFCWKVSLSLLGQHKNIQRGTFLPLFFFPPIWCQFIGYKIVEILACHN